MENLGQQGAQPRWFRYADIIIFRTVASLKAEAQKTYVGYIWWFVEPLINTLIYYMIFSKIMKRTDGFMTFLLVGTVTWQWLMTTTIISSQSVIQKAFLLQNVYLPKYIFPAVTLLSSTFKFLFLFLSLLIIVWFTGHPVNSAYVVLPLLLLLQFLLVGSFSVLVACLMPYFPDGEIVLETFLRSMMLISGIFFIPEAISPGYLLNLFYLNPMAHLIIAYRAVLMTGSLPSFTGLGYVLIFDLILLGTTIFVFKKVDRQLVKVITQS